MQVGDFLPPRVRILSNSDKRLPRSGIAPQARAEGNGVYQAQNFHGGTAVRAFRVESLKNPRRKFDKFKRAPIKSRRIQSFTYTVLR